jgi:hypothetical protein
MSNIYFEINKINLKINICSKIENKYYEIIFLRRIFDFIFNFFYINFKMIRRLMSDDDVLSEVEPDAVPNEVRNWLSMTFTRSVTNMKKNVDEKPKFKSVAQAIRAGIMVDR